MSIRDFASRVRDEASRQKPPLIRVRPPRWLGDILVAAGAQDGRHNPAQGDEHDTESEG